MKKRSLMSAIAALALLTAITPLAAAEYAEADTQSEPVSIYIDGQPAELETPSILVDSATYVSIRDFAEAMGADSVSWQDGTAEVSAPGLSVTATAGDLYLVANGRYLFVPGSCQLLDDTMMVPIRALAKAFNAAVYWDAENQAVYVTKGSGPITPGSEFYDDTDLYWLSRIITAESRGESMTGKIAVGSVIMNRLESPLFPKTIRNIIFDKQYGIQFTPAYSGAIYNTPTDECIIAAKIALDGGNTAGDSLYFASTTRCWAAKARPYALTIGNHNFYA